MSLLLIKLKKYLKIIRWFFKEKSIKRCVQEACSQCTNLTFYEKLFAHYDYDLLSNSFFLDVL